MGMFSLTISMTADGEGMPRKEEFVWNNEEVQDRTGLSRVPGT